MKKVAFLDTVHFHLENRLKENGFECLDLTIMPKDEISSKLQDVIGIVIRSRFRLDKAVLESAPNLRWIARSGAGMENIDVEYCESRGIKLFNAPEGNKNAVAEQAVGMLLALFNNLIKGDEEVRKGIWNREGNRGYEIEGKTIGIIGFGNNGSQLAQVISGFGCRILGYDKYISGFGNDRVEEVDLDILMNESDIISLHVPETDETRALVNDVFIELVKKPFYLINLSRGKVVDTDSLVKGLKSGKILGACLDVLEYEKSSFENIEVVDLPSAFKYLVSVDNVILSPHVGGWTFESYYKLSKVLADKILSDVV